MQGTDPLRCPKCSADAAPGSRFCDACGTALPSACARCGAPNRAGASFCVACGSTLAAATPASQTLDEGARKHATVLFADLRGSTDLIERLDPEAAMLRLAPALAVMADAVARFGGIVAKQQGDGLMALFGVPLATEDHAICGCLAARGIVDGIAALDESQVAARVGVATGNVVARVVGRDESDYDVVGVTVHLAARLEQAAEPGTVLVSADTARLARGAAEFAPMPPIALKGISGLVEAQRLLAARARPSWEVRAAASLLTPLVGRERELSTLLAALGDLQRGNGRALAVVGQPGVGKSRLIHEFLGALPADWRVLRAVAMPQSRGTPFHLATEILRAWIGAGPSDHPERLARLAAAALAAQMAERPADAAALRFLLDIDAGDGSWEEIEAAQRRRRVQEVLANILRGEAQRAPLIVVVEDLHWADPFSLAALDALAVGPAGTPLMLLATTRPETRPAWSRQPHAALLLEPLSPANAEQLLHQLLGPAEGLAPLRAQILARAEGTPLFLEEITRSLIESGTVDEAVTANAAGATVAAVTIPASVHSILAARIDRLPPPRRRVLQIAAVIGRHISPRLIAAVSGLDEATLADELRQLQMAEFVHATELPSGTQYVFKHALTQAEAYESLLLSQRRTLHSRVLAAMQTLFADRLDWMAEELAGHALAGEVWPEAVRHALRAGERANRRSAWHPAISFLEHAIAALEHLPAEPSTIAQAIEARLQLRVAVVAIGDVPRMMTCLDEARDLTDATGDALGAALIDIRRCIGLSMLGQIEAAIPPGEAALAVTRAEADAAGVVAASFALGQTHYISGDFRAARAVLQDSLEIARTTPLSRIAGGPGTPALLLMTCLARSLCALGDMAQARDLAEEALARAEQIRRNFDRAEAQQALGVIHLAAGRPAEAVAVLVPALDLARANEHWLLMPMIALALGPAYAATGSAAAGAVLLEEAIRRAAQHSLVTVGAQCRLALAALQAETSTAGLHSTVEDLLALSRRHRLRALEAQACRLMARLHADEPAVAHALLAAAGVVAEAGAPDTPDCAASRAAVAGSPATVLVVQRSARYDAA